VKIIAEPIEAAVWFKSKERPLPVKFRYNNSDGQICMVNVDKIICIDETKLAGIRAFVYRCQSEVGGTMMIYELKYLINDCRWELYKM
jgi:hypothetical protein